MQLRSIRLAIKVMVLGLLIGTGSSLPDVVLSADGPASVHPAMWPEIAPTFPLDAALDARIEQLIREMTLEQKVGQLIQADIGSISPDDLRHYPLGSILNGGSSSPGNNEFAPPSE